MISGQSPASPDPTIVRCDRCGGFGRCVCSASPASSLSEEWGLRNFAHRCWGAAIGGPHGGAMISASGAVGAGQAPAKTPSGTLAAPFLLSIPSFAGRECLAYLFGSLPAPGGHLAFPLGAHGGPGLPRGLLGSSFCVRTPPVPASPAHLRLPRA